MTKKDSAPGLSSSTDLALCGRVIRPHGVDGTVVVRSESDDPRRFAKGSRLFFDDGTEHNIVASRHTERGVLLKFEGVEDRNQAENLRGVGLFIPATERRRLGEDEFWPDELIGLEVRSVATGETLGTVVDYVEAGPQDRLGVAGTRGRFEVPFVRELVPEIDMAARTLLIADIEGLIP